MLLPWYLRRVIDYTFSITSGAGGFAISPQLTVVRVVDMWDSPAFILVLDLFSVLLNNAEQGVADYLENAIENLSRVFCTGYASPYDVDQYGRTLLHVSQSYLKASQSRKFLRLLQAARYSCQELIGCWIHGYIWMADLGRYKNA